MELRTPQGMPARPNTPTLHEQDAESELLVKDPAAAQVQTNTGASATRSAQRVDRVDIGDLFAPAHTGERPKIDGTAALPPVGPLPVVLTEDLRVGANSFAAAMEKVDLQELTPAVANTLSKIVVNSAQAQGGAPPASVDGKLELESAVSSLVALFLKLQIQDPNNSTEVQAKLNDISTKLRQQSLDQSKGMIKEAQEKMDSALHLAKVLKVVSVVLGIVTTVVSIALTVGAVVLGGIVAAASLGVGTVGAIAIIVGALAVIGTLSVAVGVAVGIVATLLGAKNGWEYGLTAALLAASIASCIFSIATSSATQAVIQAAIIAVKIVVKSAVTAAKTAAESIGKMSLKAVLAAVKEAVSKVVKQILQEAKDKAASAAHKTVDVALKDLRKHVEGILKLVNVVSQAGTAAVSVTSSSVAFASTQYNLAAQSHQTDANQQRVRADQYQELIEEVNTVMQRIMEAKNKTFEDASSMMHAKHTAQNTLIQASASGLR